MENAPGLPVQNAVVIFVTVAVGPGVLDDHVMVGELGVLREIQPVQDALDALVRKAGADVVARELCAGGDGVRDEISVAPEMRMDGRDVERFKAFVLELAMLYHGVFAND